LETEEQIYREYFPAYIDRFVATVGLLNPKKHIRGQVLVIGPGQMFPERYYLEVNSNVRSIVLCDTFDGQPICMPPGIQYMCMPAQNYLEDAQFYYDTVIALRISHLEKQLREGLWKQIAQHLVRGGIFIGSGGFKQPSLGQMPREFDQITRMELESPEIWEDGSFSYRDGVHMGFVVQRVWVQ
jgi:hypothetical protein